MDKSTGHVIHEGADRRSILPNAGDFRTQMIISIATALLVCVLGLIGYCGDTAYKGITSSIADLKSSNEQSFEKIWNTMSVRKANRDNQFNWVMSQCCENAKLPPPLMTAQ